MLTPPFTETDLLPLRAGDSIRISGVIYTARDAAHKRLAELIERGDPLPVALAGQAIYYVGPAPAKEGHVIGPAGPTTSGRMDAYTVPLLRLGVKLLIGKGYRSPEVKAALVEQRAIYAAAVGGAAALLARHIHSSRVVVWPELGTEAIHELTVEGFPAIVINDCHGGDAYAVGRAAWEKREEIVNGE
ncbi:MAG: fumarate hydratase C-terminal domain-containing protein [Chloroflexi bacterium]|nr:fumarate hydratase C-terminal domain-containing protein [Chloroflexota bacterium]